MNCKICNGEVSRIFSKKVLHKYDVGYHRCKNCLFIQTDEPHWLDEAYKSAINYSDIGIASRSLFFSENSTSLFRLMGLNRNSKFLDYGAGYGLYVRMMRDNGYNFFWSDSYCENIFASRFSEDELQSAEKNYEVVTAYEVFEHLVDPISEIEKILKFTDSILFSTNLINSCRGNIEDWWYISAQHGQHIAFYDKETLKYIANKYGLNLYTSKNIHFLTKKKVNKISYRVASIYQISRILNTVIPLKSLNFADWEMYLREEKKM